MADLTGVFGGPIETMRTTIANCVAFQTWTGTGTVAAAKERIIRFSDLGGVTHPFCLLSWDENTRQERDGIGVGDEYSPWPSGVILVRFEEALDSNYHDAPQDEFVSFVNTVEGIIDDMRDLFGTGGYASVEAINFRSGPMGATTRDRGAAELFVWEIGAVMQG